MLLSKKKQLEKMLADLDDALDCKNCATAVSGNAPTCIAHSGVKTTLKFLISENVTQWEVIRSIDKRLWAVVLGVSATFLAVFVQLIAKYFP